MLLCYRTVAGLTRVPLARSSILLKNEGQNPLRLQQLAHWLTEEVYSYLWSSGSGLVLVLDSGALL